MRLRLDKLVLSAGLALAMVATTIPVGATVTTKTTITNGESVTEVTAVEGLVKDNKAVSLSTSDSDELKAFYSALVGSSVADNVSLTASVPTSSIDSTKEASDVLNTKGAEQNVVVSGGKQVEAITITAKKTIDLSTELEAFKSATTKEAVATAADTFAKALASKTEEATTTEKTYNYGTYTVAEASTTTADSNKVATLAKAVAEAAAALDPQDSTTQTTLDNAIAACKTAADSTYTQDTRYTATSLPAGYSFDVILGTASTATNVKHTVYSQDRTAAKTNKEITDITELTDGTVAISVTDFTLDYFLVTTTVSTSGKLIFAQTTGDDTNGTATVTSGNYTATISNVGDNAELKAQVAEGDKYVSTFEILVNGGVVDSTTSPLTFKIAVPQDLPAVAEGYTRTFKVIRAHDNNGTTEYTTLDTTFDGTYIIFESDVFSEFALVYSDVAADTTTTEEATDAATDAATETTTAGTSTTSTTTSTKTADNSMMPLFMTTLLLALCAGSLAIYKEKKTN